MNGVISGKFYIKWRYGVQTYIALKIVLSAINMHVIDNYCVKLLKRIHNKQNYIIMTVIKD